VELRKNKIRADGSESKKKKTNNVCLFVPSVFTDSITNENKLN
jgi:hypothetical protein